MTAIWGKATFLSDYLSSLLKSNYCYLALVKFGFDRLKEVSITVPSTPQFSSLPLLTKLLRLFITLR